MEKLQAKGELGEEELRALEEDVTGKIMLASWRGTRFEVSQVLREVSVSCQRTLGQALTDPIREGCRPCPEGSRCIRPGALQQGEGMELHCRFAIGIIGT